MEVMTDQESRIVVDSELYSAVSIKLLKDDRDNLRIDNRLLRQRVDVLEGELAEGKARECRLREKALSLIAVVGKCTCLEDYKCRGLEDPSCDYHLMRPEVNELQSAISGSSPCTHAADVKRLRKLCGQGGRSLRLVMNCGLIAHGPSRDSDLTLAKEMEAEGKKGGGE
jgi:hypothetical protein